MVDLATIKPTDRTVDIRHPVTGEDIGVSVTLMPVSDDRLKRLRRQIQDKQSVLERKGKSFKAEEREKNANDFLFAAMTGWNWHGDDVTFRGERPEFNQRNVNAVFEELPWFREQIDEELGDTKSFF